jgi:hypothetical protein
MKRLRRCKLVTPSGVAGLMDVTLGDESAWDRSRGDDEGVGDVVRMSEGPLTVSLELGEHNGTLLTGYLATLVFEHYEVANNGSGGETKTTKTYTLTQGYLNRSVKQNTENPGSVTLEGNFKTLAIS